IHVDANAGIDEGAVPVHLSNGDVEVPIGDRVVGGVDLARHVPKAECGRNDDGLILSIDVETWIVFPRTPRQVDGALRRSDRGRERDDSSDIEIAVRPAIEAMSDARPERVVDGRMT